MNMIKVMINKKAQSRASNLSKELKPVKSVQSLISSTGNGAVTLQKIKGIAKSGGVNPGKMRKADIIRAIQRVEGNFDRFGTAMVGYCDQQSCLWSNRLLRFKIEFSLSFLEKST